MIITKTPLRISFFGGGTDYPESLDHLPAGGCTLSTTIDKYSFMSLAPLAELFDYRYRVSYSKIEFAQHIDQIEHSAVRACLQYKQVTEPLELHAISDLPARTGLGSSSSFTVSLLHALDTWRGAFVNHRRLAEQAVHVEREMLKERVGLQDQYACAHGGFLYLRFHPDGRVDVQPVPLTTTRREHLQSRLMLFYTGVRRTAHEVLEEQMERTMRGELKDRLNGLADLVPRALVHLTEGDMDQFGRMLDEAWRLKRGLSSRVSAPFIDEYYAKALEAGALGGKLLGAGGGGFLLFYADPTDQARVRAALADLPEVRFKFERTGSTVLFTD